MSAATRMRCAGCRAEAAPDEPYPFRCPNSGSGDDTDHVMTRVLDLAQVAWPTGDEENPFVRYRQLFHSYHLAVANGMTDEDYVDLVQRLDKEVAGVDGHGFTVTPFGRSEPLTNRVGVETWVKDDTGNVSGSHKARHLMGLAIHLEVVERTGPARADERPLAIASCGNAALAAAVVARATGRRLEVFVPTWADPPVVERLEALGAHINVCPREKRVPGDPTYHALHQAIAEGALPFTCQGPDNGLTIEGGQTPAYEIASQLREEGAGLDRIFVQVGGGALASAVIQGLREAVVLGALERMPQVHTVQTKGGYPLKRAFDQVSELLHEQSVEEALAYAAHHRSALMWPWEEEPKSVASGILDDETYDWLAVVRGMVETGGSPIVVGEERLIEANELGHAATGIDVDHTGTAGLAGLLELGGEIGPEERVAVLFTGARRGT